MFQLNDRTARRVGYTLWVVLCTVVIIGLTMTVLVMTLSRQEKAAVGGAMPPVAAYSSSYSSASSLSRS